MNKMALYFILFILGNVHISKSQNLCDRFPDLMKRINLKDIELIAGEEYVDIFTDTKEYRPAITFPQMIDDRVSSSLKVYPPSSNKAPMLQYTFKLKDQKGNEKQELERLKNELYRCGLKDWKAETLVDESFGNTFILITRASSQEKITLSTSSTFINGFSRTAVFVLQIELLGWKEKQE